MREPRRKICVLTGSRAEYGLLRWTLHEIAADPALQLQLIVTGAHLEPKFGRTIEAIEGDGFAIDAPVEMRLLDDSPTGIARAVSDGIVGVAEVLGRLKPDILLLLGDRFEVLAAATAAMISRVPIAHVHGGEATEGAFDEAIRHAVTKMAHLHFVAADAYRDRVIQLGESPDRVFVVGAAGLDNIARIDLVDRTALDRSLGLAAGGGFFVVTYHPVTLGGDDEGAVTELTAALDQFPDHQVLITGTNADPGSDPIREAIDAYARSGSDRVIFHESLGQQLYLSALKHAAAVVGNSSSGLIEAPALGVPTVNVGDRQRGRLRAASVIDCAPRRDSIVAAVRKALDPGFRATVGPARTPYGSPGAAGRIRDVLKSFRLEGILLKRFYDVPQPR